MDENRKQEAYWRDVGTLDAYYEANMDLISVDPQLNMYDRRLAHPHATSRTCRRRSSCSPSRAGGRAAARPSTALSAKAASSPAAR